jgi:hypothetical protein
MQKRRMPTGAQGQALQKPVLPTLADTPNTRRLARAMLAATIRYNLLSRPSEDSSPSA